MIKEKIESISANKCNLAKNDFRLAFNINITFLAMHIFLLSTFALFQISIMVWCNVISIMVYIGLFFAIGRNIRVYIVCTVSELLIHTVMATVCVGCNTGFQLYIFALIPIIFFCDSRCKRNYRKTVYPYHFSLISGLLFVLTTLHCQFRGPEYTISKIATIHMFVVNFMLVLGIIVLYMRIYEKITLDSEQKLARAAEEDALTGLNNRHYMNNVLEFLRDRCRRENDNISVAMMDIDDFKYINDTYGHNAGDAILVGISEKLRALCDIDTYAGRWGGEEFLIALSGNSSFDRLEKKMRGFIKDIDDMTFSIGDNRIHVTFTVGIATRNENESFEHLIGRADYRMYQGKKTGKNKVVSK